MDKSHTVFLALSIWVALAFIAARGMGARTAPRSPWVSLVRVLLQFLIVSWAAAVFVRGENVIDATLAAVVWPFLPFFFFSIFQDFPLPRAIAMAAAGLAVGVYLIAVRGRWREFWPTIAVLGFTTTFIIAGEIQFHSELARAAATLRPECLDAGSFLHSLQSTGGEFVFTFHALAIKSGERYAWSFRAHDFYRVAENIDPNLRVPASAWFSLPYPHCYGTH